MSLWQIIRRLYPYVLPYRGLVISTLLLTLVGSLVAQVNPFVLRYTVDTVQGLLDQGLGLTQGANLLLGVTAVLLGKEVINTFIQFGQKFYGEKIRTCPSMMMRLYLICRIAARPLRSRCNAKMFWRGRHSLPAS